MLNRISKGNLFKKIVAFILIILNIILFAKLKFFLPQLTGKAALLDFDTYCRLVRDAKHGINPYAISYMQSLGPPLVFVYFIFYSFLSLAKARAISTLVNILVGFSVSWLLAKKYFPKNKTNYFLIFTLIFFSAFPVRFSIEMGQPNLIATLLITLILVSKTPFQKSSFLSLLIAIKTFFLFSLLSYLRKNLKIVFKTLFLLGILIIFSFLFIKPAWYRYYLYERLPGVISPTPKGISTGLDYYNQSLKSTFNRFCLSSIYPSTEIIVFIFLSALIFSFASFELSIPSALIISPVSWQHYFATLFPILVVAFLSTKNRLSKILTITSGFLWWIEIPWLHNSSITFINSLLASHYFFSAVILVIAIILELKLGKKTKIL